MSQLRQAGAVAQRHFRLSSVVVAALNSPTAIVKSIEAPDMAADRFRPRLRPENPWRHEQPASPQAARRVQDDSQAHRRARTYPAHSGGACRAYRPGGLARATPGIDGSARPVAAPGPGGPPADSLGGPAKVVTLGPGISGLGWRRPALAERQHAVDFG
jgi:hypothetical protein